jgi:hypothetical protein
LSGPVFDCIALIAVREQFGLLTQPLRFFGKTLFEGLDLFETASLCMVSDSMTGKQPD